MIQFPSGSGNSWADERSTVVSGEAIFSMLHVSPRWWLQLSRWRPPTSFAWAHFCSLAHLPGRPPLVTLLPKAVLSREQEMEGEQSLFPLQQQCVPSGALASPSACAHLGRLLDRGHHKHLLVNTRVSPGSLAFSPNGNDCQAGPPHTRFKLSSVRGRVKNWIQDMNGGGGVESLSTGQKCRLCTSRGLSAGRNKCQRKCFDLLAYSWESSSVLLRALIHVVTLLSLWTAKGHGQLLVQPGSSHKSGHTWPSNLHKISWQNVLPDSIMILPSRP